MNQQQAGLVGGGYANLVSQPDTAAKVIGATQALNRALATARKEGWFVAVELLDGAECVRVTLKLDVE